MRIATMVGTAGVALLAGTAAAIGAATYAPVVLRRPNCGRLPTVSL